MTKVNCAKDRAVSGLPSSVPGLDARGAAVEGNGQFSSRRGTPPTFGALTNYVVPEAHGAECHEGKVETLHVVPALHAGEEQWRQKEEEQEAGDEGAGARQPPGFGWIL